MVLEVKLIKQILFEKKTYKNGIFGLNIAEYRIFICLGRLKKHAHKPKKKYLALSQIICLKGVQKHMEIPMTMDFLTFLPNFIEQANKN